MANYQYIYSRGHNFSSAISYVFYPDSEEGRIEGTKLQTLYDRRKTADPTDWTIPDVKVFDMENEAERIEVLGELLEAERYRNNNCIRERRLHEFVTNPPASGIIIYTYEPYDD